LERLRTGIQEHSPQRPFNTLMVDLHLNAAVIVVFTVISSATAVSCTSQARLLVGQWMVLTDQYKPQCNTTYLIGNSGNTYIRSNCADAASYNTKLLSATCGAGASGELSGVFVEKYDGGGTWNTTYIYCNYWQKRWSGSDVAWDWFWTTDQQSGCPSTLEAAQAKPLNGDLWKAGSNVAGTPTLTMACNGTCPRFACGCGANVMPTQTAASCNTQAELLVGQWRIVTDQNNPQCDQSYRLGSNLSTLIMRNCASAATLNFTLLNATCGAGASGELSGSFFEKDDFYIFCNYWHKRWSGSDVAWDWFLTTDHQSGCPSTLEAAHAKHQHGNLWMAATYVAGTPSLTVACHGACPRFACGCSGASQASRTSHPDLLVGQLAFLAWLWRGISVE